MSITLSMIEQLQQDVIDACQILYKEQLWEWFGEGHPSARIPGTNKFIMPGHLHPLGKGMGGVTSKDDLIVLDTDFRKISGRYDPMNEAMIHLSIYKARPDVGGIVYSHPPYCDVFAGVNKPIPIYGENIPIWDSNGAIADPKRGAGLVKALGNKNAILTRTPHSLVTCADTVRDATGMVYMIEKRAVRDYRSLLLGGLPESVSRDPRPAKGFVTTVKEFGVDVVHLDLWRFLFEKNKMKTAKKE